jgi:cyclin-dependent kinase-like
VFRRKGKLYLVFEHVDHTILEELERRPGGLDPNDVRRCMFQLLRALDFIHRNNVRARGPFDR